MVNKTTSTNPRHDTAAALATVSRLTTAYVAVVVATIAALVILSAAGSDQSTTDAWVHAVIVAGFAVLLPVRLRAARRGSSSALVAVGVIATVLAVINVVEALIPALFPVWMRIEMVAIAVLMAGIALLVARARR